MVVPWTLDGNKDCSPAATNGGKMDRSAGHLQIKIRREQPMYCPVNTCGRHSESVIVELLRDIKSRWFVLHLEFLTMPSSNVECTIYPSGTPKCYWQQKSLVQQLRQLRRSIENKMYSIRSCSGFRGTEIVPGARMIYESILNKGDKLIPHHVDPDPTCPILCKDVNCEVGIMR